MQKQTFHKPEELKKVLQFSVGRQLPLSRPLVMGILNVTPDSFSDSGQFASVEVAVEHALRMEHDGADIIDIGGESTRPGAKPVDEEKELERVLPVIKRLRDLTSIPISIDTYKAHVAEAALDAGADMVNDISGLRFDPKMAALVAERRVVVVIMHMQGSPREMQVDPHYDDCVAELLEYFRQRIVFCVEQGIDKSKIIIDPGIGFGKRLNDNIDILNRFEEFTQLGVPTMVAASRKSFIGMIHDSGKEAHHRLGGSLSAAIVGVIKGGAIVRSHDVAETVEALKVLQAVREAR
jgi:dihydropteroate synthase